MNASTEQLRVFIRALKKWAPRSCAKPLHVLEGANLVHLHLCPEAMSAHVSYAWMSISQLEELPAHRVCGACATSVAAQAGGNLPSLLNAALSYLPSPYLPAILAGQNPPANDVRARLLLAASPSYEVEAGDVADIVTAYARPEVPAQAHGWLLLARNWRYSPLEIPPASQDWVNKGWHDPASSWSLLPVTGARMALANRVSPPRKVHEVVRNAQRWPHPGRHGLTRALSGAMWKASSALEPYRPIWLEAHTRQDERDMRQVCETFMVISNLSNINSVLDLDLHQLWKAAHSLT